MQAVPPTTAAPGAVNAAADAAAQQACELDVAIIGGGPGGLATAKAILTVRPDLHVGVFERATLRPRGAALMVQPNGVAALAAIDPALADAVQAIDTNPTAYRRRAPDGTLTQLFEGGDSPMEYARHHGGPTSMCAWHELQSVLAAALPPGVLHQNAAFERLEEAGSGVTLHFSGHRPPVTARLVVGADGGQLAVRQQVIGDGQPVYIGTAIWRAVAPKPAWFPSEPGFYCVFGQPPIVFAHLGMQGPTVVWQPGI